jgi:hypothetical protein
MVAAPQKRMLSAEEAAEYCGFPTPRRFLAHVRVKPVNYGNCVRYDRQRLDEWLDSLGQSQPMNEMAFVEAAGDASARDRH